MPIQDLRLHLAIMLLGQLLATFDTWSWRWFQGEASSPASRFSHPVKPTAVWVHHQPTPMVHDAHVSAAKHQLCPHSPSSSRVSGALHLFQPHPSPGFCHCPHCQLLTSPGCSSNPNPQRVSSLLPLSLYPTPHMRDPPAPDSPWFSDLHISAWWSPPSPPESPPSPIFRPS